ncbi:MAG: Fe-S cluster assembly protein SufD [Candidatus Polarisedimenticolia bacterium]
MTKAAPADPAQRYVASFERRRTAGAEPAWLDQVRKDALASFAEQGFPTTKEEAWRYTSVAALARTPFEAAPQGARAEELDAPELERLLLGDWDACRVVFVNGRHAPILSRGAGALVEPLGAAIRRDEAALRGHLTQVAGPLDNPFTALNTALFEDGALVRIPRGTALPGPLHIVFVTTSDGAPLVTYPRCLVVAEAGSQAALVESYVGAPATVSFTNTVTEIQVDEGATVEHTRVQRESPGVSHIGALHARLARNATLVSHAITLGASLSRIDVRAELAGTGADVTLNGLYVLSGSQHADHHTLVDHVAPHGTSRELYKGVLDGQSRGVFDGTIVVRQDAQKTDSRQENRNLILSGEALVDSKPTLRIHADDVKCSHAATIGQMDENAMFYLRTRALDPGAARQLLIHAFVVDVLSRLRVVPLRAALETMLSAGEVAS